MSEQAVMDPPKEGKKGKTAQEANAEYNEKDGARNKRIDEQRQKANSASISSVKYVGGKVFINYEVVEDNATKNVSERYDGEPSSAFIEALKALAPFVSDIVFRDKAEKLWQAPRITVKGVNFKEHDEGNLHAGIVTTLTLNNGKDTNIIIPQMPLYPEDEHTSGYTEEARDAIEEVMEQTRAFLAGQRATGNLFAGLDD
jgi:hypothetical protein